MPALPLLPGPLAAVLMALVLLLVPQPARAAEPVPGTVPGAVPGAGPGAAVTLLFITRTGDPAGREGEGGLAPLSTLVARERAAGRPLLLLHGGDTLTEGSLSAFDEGAHQIDLLNQLGVDVLGVQARDFNNGEDILSLRAQEAIFAVVASNVEDRRSARPLDGLERAVLLQAGPVKIGVVALMGREDLMRTNARDSRILDPLEMLRVQAAALRGRGARLVVALASDRGDLDRGLADSGLADIVATVPRPRQPPGGFRVGETLTVVPGDHGSAAVAVDLSVPADPGGKVRETVRVLGTAGLPPDPEMARRVDSYVQRLAPRRHTPVLTLTAPVDSRIIAIRQGENALGNLVADTLRQAMHADVALVNGGVFRSYRLYPAGTVLTRQDVLDLFPFRNRVLLLQVTGEQLRAAVENGLSALGAAGPPDGRFPHLSNMQVLADLGRPPGQRVQRLLVEGAPVRPTGLYRLAATDFLAEGGDGYSMLVQAPRLLGPAEADLLATILMAEWGKRQTAGPKRDGRLQLRHTPE